MNKNQEKISEDLILFLKSKNGMATSQDVMNNVDGFNNNRWVVIRGLKELKLIDNAGSNSYLLTVKGFNFKSFADLKRKKLIKEIKKNISFIISILLGLLTIYLSIVNSNLSKSNEDVFEQLIKLKEELHQLDAQTTNRFYQLEKSLSDTIK